MIKKIKNLGILFSAMIFHGVLPVDQDYKDFLIVITSYNNKDWYQKNLNSIFEQDYPRDHVRVIYVDDFSPDGTGNLVKNYIRERGWEDRCTVVISDHRRYKMENLRKAIIDYGFSHEIVVEYDGDDWLDNSNVLALLNTEYQNNDIWVTYGEFWEWPTNKRSHWSIPVPANVIEKNAHRTIRGMIWGALRTYYVWLFKLIKEEDLMLNGKYYIATSDAAIMFPMLEMAGYHYKYIPKFIYVHNVKTPLNDHKVHGTEQWQIEHHVRKLPAYKKLTAEEAAYYMSC